VVYFDLQKTLSENAPLERELRRRLGLSNCFLRNCDSDEMLATSPFDRDKGWLVGSKVKAENVSSRTIIGNKIPS
jgi:hypothetical protein